MLTLPGNCHVLSHMTVSCLVTIGYLMTNRSDNANIDTETNQVQFYNQVQVYILA